MIITYTYTDSEVCRDDTVSSGAQLPIFEGSLSLHIFPDSGPLQMKALWPSAMLATTLQWHSITHQNTWFISNTADMTSKHEQLCGRQVTLTFRW